MSIKQRISLAWRIIRSKDGNLVQYAKDELGRHLSVSTDPWDKEMMRHILDMTRVFSEADHSNSSASFALSLLCRVLAFKPLNPLTGGPDEWTCVDGVCNYQNRRCSSVFRNVKEDSCIDIDGFVFRNPDGVCYTNFNSRRAVTFPYMPKKVYVDVPMDATSEQELAAIAALDKLQCSPQQRLDAINAVKGAV